MQNQYHHPSQQVGHQQPSPVNNNYPTQSYQQQPLQPNYQHQISERSQYPSAQQFNEPDPTYMRQGTPSYLQSPPPAKPPSCTAAFAGGVSVKNKPVAPDNRWSHVQPAKPVQSGYIQSQFNQQPASQYQQPSQYQSESAYANQYHPQQQVSLSVTFPSPNSTNNLKIEKKRSSSCYLFGC